MTIMSNDSLGEDRRIPAAALVLGWAGVIPFAGGAVALMLTRGEGTVGTAVLVPLLAYGALILSFLGGARFALAFLVRDRDLQARRFALAMLPSLVGWIAACLHARPLFALGVLILGHLLQCAWDLAGARGGECPAWYGRLRLRLTGAAVCALAIAALAMRLPTAS